MSLSLIATAVAHGADTFPAISPDVLTQEQKADARGMIDRDIERRTAEFNTRHREQWSTVQSRRQWEAYRDERINRLRGSLGTFPPAGKPNVRVTGTLAGDGFKIENTLYESRPGQWVTGNLYVPATPRPSMPAILIVTAHHNAKVQTELMDMGMTWARAGCQVLVIDQVGYGERRAHPFNRDADYAKPYRASRQDYYFRYDSGVQLQLLGDSLMGWMVWDQMRGVDVLLDREGTDPKRIIIIGSVAGGGDPAGITAALDPRIACCVPFNFGGPQPETRYPLPDDAEKSFNFLSGTYWDSTRGLRLTARDDFPHWIITASLAPRRLIHGHEFSWDGDHDPVWKRYQKVWGDFYGSGELIGVAHGKGVLKLRPPEASHCSNIGQFHRRMIHPLFDQWFGIKVTEKDEYSAPRKSEELICLTPQAQQELKPKRLLELMSNECSRRVDAALEKLAKQSPTKRPESLRAQWSSLLGQINPAQPKVTTVETKPLRQARLERLILEVEVGISVPVLVLSPAKSDVRTPVVVAVAQAGKAGFLKDRSGEIEHLLKAGVAVVLPDLRGTGETASGTSRGRDSGATNQSVQLQQFGETFVGQRLRDLRSVLAYVRTRPDIDAKRIALWGDSFTPPNAPGTDFKVPHAVDGWPRFAEPLGGLLGLLGALFEDDIRVVYAAGGLAEYQGVLRHYAVLVPHDAAVPGALAAGDLPAIAATLSPKRIRLARTVNHLNQLISEERLRRIYTTADNDARQSPTDWLIEELRATQ